MIVGTYMIVCEGASECNYLDHLNRFLATLPMPVGNCPVPLRFIACPKHLDPKSGNKVGCGGGDFGKVTQAYKSEWRKNKTYPFGVWVDADLYVRNDRGARDRYVARPPGIPPFDFSILNFEDFLALHFEDEVFMAWCDELSAAGHFESPLHWEKYEEHYRKIFPEYQKNRLPVDFLNVARLTNLFQHMNRMPQVAYNGLPVERTFAGLLKQVLPAAYPAIWPNLSAMEGQI